MNKRLRKEEQPRGSATPAPPPPSSLVLQEDDADFPRGGGSMLSREEAAAARAEGEAEFEREERESGKGRDKRKRKGAKTQYTEAAENDLGSLFSAGVTGRLPRFANRITLKNISPRMKLWGVVVEVNSKDLVISLPGGLRGFVRAEEVSDIILDSENKESENNLLFSIFAVGQLVSCMVLQVDDDKREGKGNKRIWLSLRLSLLYKGLTLDAVQDGMVLIAQVKSVEDHGYILHFGVSSFTGFLARSERDDGEICRGQLLQSVVKSVDKARAVAYLNSDPDLVSKCVTKDLKGLSIDLLVPGMMVNARVHATLENGIMLSFLTYFTGTVDIFHLQSSFPSGTWKDEYNQNKKVKARILFIDPSTRAVGLTMNTNLVHNKVPPSCVKTGDIYDNSRIIRVDRGAGLLLEIPSSPVPSPAYVCIFDAADEEVLKLEKKFKEGSHVRVRVLGMRHLEGLAMGTLKATAFDGSIFTHSDVKPGMLVKAQVIAVEDFGVIVQFSSGVKALCPIPHLSEFEIAKPTRKFKVGAKLLFRVLGCKSKRITITHKRTLVKSKLNVLASYADAIDGLITHGWITKIEKHGCFVRFYNGVQGFAHRSELGLEPGIEASTMYHVGQVVKCRIINSVPASRRINVSLVISPKRVCEDDVASLGSLVSGVVERLTPAAVIVHVNKNAYLKGTIANDHLADHQGQATLLRSLLRPGYEFDKLLVLDIEGNNLVLSAKFSLVNSAQDIPLDIAQIHPHFVAHGYICNLIETGCFVRFLGRLTGFSPKNKATDEQIDSLSDAFYRGQSVRSHIVDVNIETGRIKLSLKQSSCFSTDVSFIQGYFLLEEKITALQLQLSETKNSDLSSMKSLSIGSVVEGEIQEIKEFGVVLRFKDYDDVVGFIAHHQLGGINLETGSFVRALVLDIAKSDGLVDLSLKPELVSSASLEGVDGLPSKKKRRRAFSMDLELHQTVNAVVEIVKENYLVLSVPEYNYAIGYASITDYNTQNLRRKNFMNGQSVLATVGALSSPYTSGRLLLLLKSLTEVRETSSFKRALKKCNYSVGSVVEAEIIDKKPLELLLKFGIGFRGRVHITEVFDADHYLENPFSSFRIGQLIKAKIVAQSGQNGRGHQWELSVRPCAFRNSLYKSLENIVDLHPNMVVQGYVKNVTPKGCFITLSRSVDARILLSNLSDWYVENPEKEFPVGKLVHGRVLSVEPLSKRVEITLKRTNDGQLSKTVEDGIRHLHVGDIISGRIRRTELYGLFITIDSGSMVGLCHISELSDEPVNNIETKYRAGDKVVAKILKVDEERQRISLGMKKSYVGDANDAHITSTDANNDEVDNNAAIDDIFLGLQLDGNSSFSQKIPEQQENGCSAILAQAESRASVLPLQVSLGDSEDSDVENDATINQDDAKVNDVVAKRNDGRLKKKAKEERELEICAAEERCLQNDVPRTADEFEKLARSSPNCSFVWIKYMAFMLSLADVERARAIAERALKTINIREEGEKLNLWVAYFNLENEYGSPPEEAVKKTFQRALQYCDPKKLHLALLGMYERSKQYKLAEELLERMTKKFKNSCKVWLRRVQSLSKQGKDGSQSVVKRALLSLPRRKHIKFISQAAILEFKCGMPDRGRSMFEGILREYPKRTDLWNVYLDQEIRLGDVEVIRALFERATCLSLPPKKMKFLFKKYLEYEKSHGDVDRIEHVKRKALEYVETSLA